MVADRARDKLDRSLDLVRVIKTMRKVDLISKIVLNEKQRKIIQGAPQNVISSDPLKEYDSASDYDFS